jgi:aryl-alcohol dehydrogenase
MRITAAVATEPRAPLQLREVELDAPRPDEVRVELVATGVCHTDAAIRDQLYPTPLPAVLGHEGAGVVRDIGSEVRAVSPGDHVVLSMNSCGVCDHCREARPTYCADGYARNFGGRRPDGSTALHDGSAGLSAQFFGQSSFATHANVAERSVVRVPADLPLHLLAPLGCGVQTGAGAVLNVLRPGPGASVVVFGAGSVGSASLLATRLTASTQLIAVDLLDERLEAARRLGATEVVHASREDVVERLTELTGGRGPDFAVETTGSPEVLRQAARAIAARGTVGLVGAAAPGTETPLETGFSLTKGWTLRTVVEGDAVPQTFIPHLAELWRQGRLPFDEIVTTYPFARINEAIADAEQGRTIKPVLLFG